VGPEGWPAWKAPRAGGLPLFVALGCLLCAAPAHAEATLADGFVYVPGESGEVGCLSPRADGPLPALVKEALAEVELDPHLAVVLTARPLACSSIYYTALANDVTGIGYQRSDASEVFDYDPETALEGVAFLNDLPYWFEYPEEFRSAFLHELGHRWLARVHALAGGVDVDLTGRQGGHWSYFLDSSGSPLEGNAWQGDGGQASGGQGGAGPDEADPTTDTPAFAERYSPLDLYLMGAYAADEVPPFRLLTPEPTQARDCNGAPVTRFSPPQTCEPLTLPGSWTALTVEDVIAAEGPRQPGSEQARTTFSVAFLLLDPGGVDFDSAACSNLGATARDLIEHFGAATDGRLALVNAVTPTIDCEELDYAVPASSGCQVAASGRFGDARGRPIGSLLGLLLGLAALSALRTRSKRRSTAQPG